MTGVERLGIRSSGFSVSYTTSIRIRPIFEERLRTSSGKSGILAENIASPAFLAALNLIPSKNGIERLEPEPSFPQLKADLYRSVYLRYPWDIESKQFTAILISLSGKNVSIS